MGDTSADAMASALKNHPDKVFYIAQIGFDVAEMVARYFHNA